MDTAALLVELYERIPPLARTAVDGLDAEQLTRSPEPGANTIGWLVWHLTRVQDDHVAELLDDRQLWVTGDWAGRFGVDPDPTNSGYGHTREQMEAIEPDGPDALVEYLDAVHSRTVGMLSGLGAEELDRVVDDNWDPPVTMGVRLVSVADDSLQHLGQAAYVRGMLGMLGT